MSHCEAYHRGRSGCTRTACRATRKIFLVVAILIYAVLRFYQGVLDTLGNQLAQLEDEIKADEAGKKEFERLLAQVGWTLFSKHSVPGGRTMLNICGDGGPRINVRVGSASGKTRHATTHRHSLYI